MEVNVRNEQCRNEAFSSKDKISILARLMNDLPMQSNPELYRQWIQLYNSINDDFAAALEKSSVHGKEEVINKLNIALQSVDVLREHEEVIGDTVIGFLGSDLKIFSEIFNIDQSDIQLTFPPENLSIPSVWTHEEQKEVYAENIYDAQVPISIEEMNLLFKNLDNTRIDSLVRFFYVCEPVIPENITVISFPPELKELTAINEALLEKVDIFVTVWDGKVTKEKDLLERFIKYTERNGALFFIAVKDEKFLKSSYREVIQLLHLSPSQSMLAEKKKGQINIQVGSVTVRLATIKALNNELYDIYEKNESRKNYSLKDEMEAVLLDISKEYEQKEWAARKQGRWIAEDLVFLADSDIKTKKRIEKENFSFAVSNQRKKDKDEFNYLNRIMQKVLNDAGELEDKFDQIAQKSLTDNQLIKPRERTLSTWYTIVLRAVDAYTYSNNNKYIKIAKDYLNKLQRNDYKSTYILQMLIDKSLDHKISEENIERLKKEKDKSYIISVSKMRLAKELGIQDEEFAKIAKQFNADDKNIVYYCEGNEHWKNQQYEEALNCYRSAWLLGNLNAREKYFSLKNDDFLKINSVQEVFSERDFVTGKNFAQNGDYDKALIWYQKAAELGNKEAMASLADCYFNGRGVCQNIKEGIKWYEKAANAGNADAMFTLGNYYNSQRVGADAKKTAFMWLRKAAELNHEEAMLSLASSYYFGKGIKQDRPEALKWLERAANIGNEKAITTLYTISRKGEISVEDSKQLLELYKKAADIGIVDAMYSLGQKYYLGQGVEKNPETALDWLKKAADLEDSNAMCMLGNIYFSGEEVTQDYENAWKWYKDAASFGNGEAVLALYKMLAEDLYEANDEETAELRQKAADLGNAEAMYNLGEMYYFEQDSEKAIIWYKKAAEVGNINAINDLYYMYSNGDGVKSDYKEAIHWCEKGAELGDIDAMVEVGNAYRDGHGVQQDYTKAIRWYEEAYNRGNTDVIITISDCYYRSKAIIHSNDDAIKWHKKAAELGNTDAMIALGDILRCGEGCSVDYEKAVQWYQQAIKLGNNKALCVLGLMYKNGQGVEKNDELALQKFHEAAELGDPIAMVELANYYRNGKRLEKDSESMKWYHRAADLGNKEAINELYIYYTEKATPKNQTDIIEWSKKAAESNNSDAMVRLGNAYRLGLGLNKDNAEAIKCYLKAAGLGNQEAMLILGKSYSDGQGVDQNFSESIKWYQSAAELGNGEAVNSLCSIIISNPKLVKEPEKFVKWYQNAALLGNDKAIYLLGEAYRLGSGVAQDNTEAVRWFKQAEALGNTKALYMLGEAYLTGQGVVQNSTEAMKYYQRSANLGNCEAMNRLAEMHYVGNGTAQNYDKAIYWYQKSIELGNDIAKQKLSLIYIDAARNFENADAFEAAKKWYQMALDLGYTDAKIDILRIADRLNAKVYNNIEKEEKDVYEEFDEVEEAPEYKCPVCGNTLAEDDTFCDNCGNKIKIANRKVEIVKDNYRCPVCGNSLEEWDAFCDNCGLKLVIKCPRCRHDIRLLKNKTCAYCGFKITYCPNCHDIIYEGQSYCTKCGNKIE